MSESGQLLPVRRHWLFSALLALFLAGCTNLQARAAEADRIATVLDLREGTIVADIGAGDGEWSVELARRVGQSGHVFATEVDDELVAEIRAAMQDARLENFTVVEGDQTSSGLEGACCDAVLLRMVYHHFEEPELMRADLWRALRPGGLIGIVDIVPQKNWRELDEVPDRGGHGLPTAALVTEMLGSGFELVERHDNWNGDADRYCIVFRRALAGADLK